MVGNYMKLSMRCVHECKDVILAAIASFAEELNPAGEELDEIRKAVFEAVDNCVLHAYPNDTGTIWVHCKILKNNVLGIIIKDEGVGIEDVEQATRPLFSTKENHSGLGITVMESFMTEVKISSVRGKGTIVNMKKHIG